MRLPISWLNDILSKPLEPAVIEETLTRTGLEVESMDYRAPGLETVVVGQIVAIDKHPNADKLRICQTDVGTGTNLQIVTGAQNVQLNDKIPVALVGSVLPGDKAINASKLRGVDSFGMYCSLVELGLAEESEGVHVLPTDAVLGMPIANAMQIGELVLDVAVTANRPDALSVVGIARELVAALPGVELKLPAAKAVAHGGTGTVRLGGIDPERCPRYLGLNVAGVQIAPSPEWLAKRLEAAGMRAINNVVDATNYVMLLTGQPLHAFDTSKIKGHVIHVRPAHAGETLVTLDKQERKLTSDDLVIADDARALVVAGVMGGADAEVDAETTDLFLEAAYFKPTSVRMTSRRLGLSTESSYRFERGVDPEGTAYALQLVRDLILELAGGSVEGNVHEALRAGWPETKRFTFRLDRVATVLGVEIPNPDVERILTGLGFGLSRHTDGVFELASYDVTVPGWRYHDVTREVDLIEELGRHFGYDKIPAVLPSVVAKPKQPMGARLEERARAIATGLGLSEVLTNSLTSHEAEALAGVEGKHAVKLANPLGEQMTQLRTSMFPSLMGVLRHNRYQGQNRFGAFELGRTYALEGDAHAAVQRLWLAGAVMTSTWEGQWLVEHTPEPLKADFFYAKGLVENLFAGLEVEGSLTFRQSSDCPSLHPGRAAELLLDGESVGFVGEVHPRVAEAYDMPPGASVVAWTLDLGALSELSERRHRFSAFSRFPASLRDLAVLVDAQLPAEEALAAIREAGAPLLEKVSLFDRYEGAQVPDGKVSLGFSLVYRAPDRTLAEGDIEPTQARILETLKERCGAVMRG